MNTPELPIDTSRLTLRFFEPADFEAVSAYYGLPDVQRYLDRQARDSAEIRAAVDGMVHQRRLHRPGDTIALAAVRRADSRPIGQLSLRWTDATAGQSELRFAFDPVCSREGYMAEALRAGLDIGFEELGFHRIFVRCSARHQGTAKVLKGLGMRLEAHYREHALFQGEWDEELHFAMLDREWLRSGKVHEITRHMVA